MCRLLLDSWSWSICSRASCDANGYLFATIPSTVNGPCPTVGFIAHVDTSPEMSGKT